MSKFNHAPRRRQAGGSIKLGFGGCRRWRVALRWAVGHRGLASGGQAVLRTVHDLVPSGHDAVQHRLGQRLRTPRGAARASPTHVVGTARRAAQGEPCAYVRIGQGCGPARRPLSRAPRQARRPVASRPRSNNAPRSETRPWRVMAQRTKREGSLTCLVHVDGAGSRAVIHAVAAHRRLVGRVVHARGRIPLAARQLARVV